MTKHQTCLKYFILAFDNRIEDKIERKANIVIFADSEQEAIEKAKTVIKRKFYEIFEVNEVIDVLPK